MLVWEATKGEHYLIHVGDQFVRKDATADGAAAAVTALVHHILHVGRDEAVCSE